MKRKKNEDKHRGFLIGLVPRKRFSQAPYGLQLAGEIQQADARRLEVKTSLERTGVSGLGLRHHRQKGGGRKSECEEECL